jgi:hypothetical protein
MAESSKEGYGSETAVLPMVVMTMKAFTERSLTVTVRTLYLHHSFPKFTCRPMGQYEVQLSLCVIKHQAMKAYGGVDEAL